MSKEQDVDLRDGMADALNEVIALTRNIQSMEGLSETVREEGAVLGRAAMVFGGHLMNELGLRYEQNGECEMLADGLKDGDVVVISGGKPISIGNVHDVNSGKPISIGNVLDVNKCVSVITKIANKEEGEERTEFIKGSNDKSQGCENKGKEENKDDKECAYVTYELIRDGFKVKSVEKFPHIEGCFRVHVAQQRDSPINRSYDACKLLPCGWGVIINRLYRCLTRNSGSFFNCDMIDMYIFMNGHNMEYFKMCAESAKRCGMSLVDWLTNKDGRRNGE